MGICAYCDQDRKLTREHVWSDSILKVFMSVAPKTYDLDRKLVHEGDPVLKDTCAACNTSLSDADSFAMQMVRDHFQSGPPTGGQLALTDDRLWRWVFKTAFNLHRFGKHSVEWALPIRAYLIRKAPRPKNLSLFFAAWDDLSPAGVALKFNIVHWLDARQPHFDLLDSVSDAQVREHATMATAIKPGYGVFLPLVWKQPDPYVLPTLREELLSHGWLDCAMDGTPSAVPFDMFSSGQFEILVPSQKYAEFISVRKAAIAGEAAAFGKLDDTLDTPLI